MILGFLRCFAYFALGIPVTLAGFVVVALALPFRWAEGDAKPFTQYPELGSWQRWRLPSWALWWDNAFDGALGDKRGWWANCCRETYGKPEIAFRCMWEWLAKRNPANWWSRVITGLDMSQCVVDLVAGQEVVSDSVGRTGWQLLRALRADGKCFPRFYGVWPYRGRPDKAVMIDIGWKIKLSHNGTKPDADPSDRLKGSVFSFSPWKSL